MKKSFGGGGGGMSRSFTTVQRSVRAAGGGGGGGGGGEAQDPFPQSNNANKKKTHSNNNTETRPTYKNIPSTTTPNTLSLSLSSPLSSSNFLFSAAPTWPTCDELGWECINGTEDDIFYDDFVFGSVPSKDEAQHALSALQQVYFSDMDGTVPSSDSDSDWIEHSVQLCNSRTQPQGSDSVHKAFHLLQTEPSVQRMVISLSSDKAVWDAVLNNEVVLELRALLNEGVAENTITGSKDEGSNGSNAAMEILRRIFFNAKTKVVELIEKITELVYDLFLRPSTTEGINTTDPFEEKLRTSFMLSVVVFLIVAFSRSHKA